MKTVICTDASKAAIKNGSMTIGKPYKVVKELGTCYIIINNFGLKPSVSKSKFQEIDEIADQPIRKVG